MPKQQINQMKIKRLESEQEWEQVMQLRQEVFVKEQGVPPELELDGKDSSAVHFLVLVEAEIVGTCRLRSKNKVGKVERMAVKKEFRNQGMGSQLLKHVVQFAEAEGLAKLTLHAQKQAVGFYQQQGFEITSSEIIQEAGIDHFQMAQEL